MEKWLRTGTSKRKANDTGDATLTVICVVVTTNNMIGLLLKLKKQAVKRKNTVGNMTVQTTVIKCCRTSA
jgi:hypothetical protein